jgi:hypothetical protein
MLGFILVITYFGAALLAAAILLQSDWFTVTRSANVNATPDVVFRHINELRNWEAWSPWAKLDPQAQTAYSGPPAGAGASFEWSGDKKVGAGRMTIVDSKPNESVDLKLEMQRPFKASNDVSFMLQPEGGASTGRTTVTWTMSGRNNLLSKAMNLIKSRDKMIGAHFEKGLDNLNAVVVS